jgi:hypothetical protein
MWLINELKWRICPHFFFLVFPDWDHSSLSSPPSSSVSLLSLLPLFFFFFFFFFFFLLLLSSSILSYDFSLYTHTPPLPFLYAPTITTTPSPALHSNRVSLVQMKFWCFFFSIQLTRPDVDVGIPDTQTHSATSHHPPPRIQSDLQTTPNHCPKPPLCKLHQTGTPNLLPDWCNPTSLNQSIAIHHSPPFHENWRLPNEIANLNPRC